VNFRLCCLLFFFLLIQEKISQTWPSARIPSFKNSCGLSGLIAKTRKTLHYLDFLKKKVIIQVTLMAFPQSYK